ncbi:hypothetical protein [Actinomadura harenae]|uniref:Uncharacterized protein n=1 Tax=Actinomadura harenae TaxID=2483351 RepID=A0A3M2MGL1_9ACTN|nr:hypothetical protein [Actinomadura harenae]RMI47805.1 hypothetical protein EBO15_00460 [Actinomadura harenae]
MANDRHEPRYTPHDAGTERLSRDLAENVRQLNHATAAPLGLTQPGTVYTVLGNLTSAAHGLDQTLDQLNTFLLEAEQAGSLNHDNGLPVTGALADCSKALTAARNHARDLGAALGQAQVAINAVHGTCALDGGLHPARLAAQDCPYSIEELLAREWSAQHQQIPPTPSTPGRGPDSCKP